MQSGRTLRQATLRLGRGSVLAACLLLGPEVTAQVVVDRIVLRIEDVVITQSEVRELGCFSALAGGERASDDELIERLISQWIVMTEIETTRYSPPPAAAVDELMAQYEASLGTPAERSARLAACGLNETRLRKLVERQIWMARYVDYRFRAAVQVYDEEINAYYRDELVPKLTARGVAIPPLETQREAIREVLAQRLITEQFHRWITETRARLRIERLAAGGRP